MSAEVRPVAADCPQAERELCACWAAEHADPSDPGQWTADVRLAYLTALNECRAAVTE